jgi:putative NIF3 family GTP cyclohydrolase 1 type 2
LIGGRHIQLDEITAELDAYFALDSLPPDSPFSRLLPATYEGKGIRLETILERAFLERFHGLMIRGSPAVERTYGAVFLSDEIVAKVAARGARNALLICHHPLGMETSGRGFLPLSEVSLVAIQDRGISVYILHTPLDVHAELSTSGALARELGMGPLGRYDEVPGGYAGVYGRLPAPLALDVLVQRVREVSGVPDVHFIAVRPTVQTIAVLGGGTDVRGIQEATALGCDALVTGTYQNQVQNEIGRRYRAELDRLRGALAISLIECSHYASEAVAMRHDMADLCAARLGMDCEFVPQDDPWY